MVAGEGPNPSDASANAQLPGFDETYQGSTGELETAGPKLPYVKGAQ